MCEQTTYPLIVSSFSSISLYVHYRVVIKKKLGKVLKLKAWHTVRLSMTLDLLSVTKNLVMEP